MLPTLPSEIETKDQKAKVHVQTFEGEEGAWSVELQFPEPLTYSSKVSSNSLFLEFNQPIDTEELSKIQENVGSLIKRVSNGYDTLYIVTRGNAHFLLEEGDQKLCFGIIPDSSFPMEANRQSKVAYARFLIEERDYFAAQEYLEILNDEYPCDKDVLVLAASLEGFLPRWQNQVAILSNLNEVYPEDEDINLLARDALTPHSSYVRAERQMQRTVSIAAVQVYRLEAEQIVDYDCDSVLYAGARYQLWDGHVSAIVNNLGESVGFRGWRNQAALSLRKDYRDGRFIKGTLFDQKGAFGCGLDYGELIPSIQGAIRTELFWHRPNWEIFECLAYNGREDRAYSALEGVYSRNFSWLLGGGVRRMGITGVADGYTSVLANGGIFLNLILPNPTFGISYSIDAEYVLREKVEIGANGLPFNPVPYTSFENHTFLANMSYVFRERWNLTGHMGRTFNRLGLNDNNFGASLTYIEPIPCGWEFRIAYDHFPSTIVSGAVGEFITGTLTYRY